MNTLSSYIDKSNVDDDFCLEEALSHDIFSLELEEKDEEIKRLEGQIDSLDRQLNQWIRIAGYWQDKASKK